VVIIGSGFAGFHAARSLARRSRGTVEILVVSPTNYFLYLPLLPEVAGGILEARRIAIALSDALPSCVHHAPGEVDAIDLDAREIGWLDPEGVQHRTTYDRLVLAAGSVHKVMPIPGVAENAVGFRGVPEAFYLRDHLIRQIDLAEMCDDPAERAARCTFVVVGAGYTGTEVAAQGQLFTRALARSRGFDPDEMRWVLVSRGEVLAGLDEHLSRTADEVLRRRGVEVHTHTTMEEAREASVRLSSGESIPTRTLLWCVGVRADPLIENLDIDLVDGRVVVHETLQVPGHRSCTRAGTSRPSRTRAVRASTPPRPPSTPCARVRSPAGTWRRRWGTGRYAPTGTAISASSSTSGASRRPRRRCASR
jgi:NADH dehydrogenase